MGRDCGDIIPRPAFCEAREGVFCFEAATRIFTPAELAAEADVLAGWLGKVPGLGKMWVELEGSVADLGESASRVKDTTTADDVANGAGGGESRGQAARTFIERSSEKGLGSMAGTPFRGIRLELARGGGGKNQRSGVSAISTTGLIDSEKPLSEASVSTMTDTAALTLAGDGLSSSRGAADQPQAGVRPSVEAWPSIETRLSSEAYELVVAPDGIVIRAADGAGIVRGAASLWQLALVQRAEVGALVVRDEPRFAWRGLMLDCARNFFEVTFIEKILDLAALHKLNVFHWHLTDDQAWRIEIPSHSELTERGAYRRDHRFNIEIEKGGYYTTKDIARIVAYAAARHIAVVPEIESPGHATALLASHPEFSCRGSLDGAPDSGLAHKICGEFEGLGKERADRAAGHGRENERDVVSGVSFSAAPFIANSATASVDTSSATPEEISKTRPITTWVASHEPAKSAEPEDRYGIFDDILCAGNGHALAFFDDILDELCAMFPGSYVHMGGDETPKTRWLACPACRGKMRELGLRRADGEVDAEALQAWFMGRLAEMLARRGKRMIGWDEVVEGGVSSDVTVMSWRNAEYGAHAAKLGYDVVMCPQSHACYLDHKHLDVPEEPGQIGTCTVKDSYLFEPVVDGLGEAEAAHILGGQANLWTELVYFGRQAEYMLFPRLCALSEAFWTPKPLRDFDDFSARLKVHIRRLDALDVLYYKGPLS